MKRVFLTLERWIERLILLAVVGGFLVPTLLFHRVRDTEKLEEEVRQAAFSSAAEQLGIPASNVVDTLAAVESAPAEGGKIVPMAPVFIPPELAYGTTTEIFFRRAEGIRSAPALAIDLAPAPPIAMPGFILEGGPLSGFQHIRRDRTTPRTIAPDAPAAGGGN